MTNAANLKLVFCGTPQFAVPTLEALLAAGHDIALVVSQPDRPVGRAQRAHRSARKADRTGRGPCRHATGKDPEQRGVSRAA